MAWAVADEWTIYTLALALVEPGALKPSFRLAIDVPEKNSRYEVGKVRVE